MIVKPLCRRLALVISLTLPLLGLGQAPGPRPVDKDHAVKMQKGMEVFRKHVKPVLVQRCLRCHGEGEKLGGELDLSDRTELLKGGNTGPGIVPGKHRESLLWRMITHQREPFMPRNSKKLPDEVLAKMAEWIDLGAPYDEPLIARKDRTPAWTTRVVAPEARAFWAFQPLKKTEPPQVRNRTWCKTPIDRFILAKMEEKGLTPNPQADHRILLRRMYFDLIGLPPTPEETAAFAQAASRNPLEEKSAIENVIDRLLASPHYGERWARHWLDLARFAESHGFEHDYDRPNAYHYRDFVIRAFNSGLPYDTFVKWQIAGDELAPDNNLALMATGFLAAGVHSTQITANEAEKHRYDHLDDKLSTISTAMLGLTLGCARCHDHKYDPFPQADYYRMLATFTTTVKSEVELNFDPESYKKAKAEFDRAHAPLVAALRQFEREQAPARLARWESGQRQPLWIILDPAAFKSAGGATLTKQEDGSLLVSGKNPNQDTFTITAEVNLNGITALRLEALSDPSLVKGGPGRADNGNFALTDWQVTFIPKKAGAKPQPVVLKNPRVTFEQKGLPAAAIIDKDQKTGWAVDPQFGKDHAVAFELAAPLTEPGTLTFTLQFKNNVKHAIGRPRFSVALDRDLALQGAGLPQALAKVLDKMPDQRHPEEKEALARWYTTIDPEGSKLHQAVREHLRKAPKPDLRKVLIATEGLPPVRMHTQGPDFYNETHFLRRGETANKEGIASQGFLQVLTTAPVKKWQVEPPPGWRTSNRRTALANWITDTQHGAGHLLARVIVNRLWQHHLGRGIVATPSDFGQRGERPTHPELLDWLAGELIRNGWQLKPIYKLIMTSAVYQQSSRFEESRAKLDRDNQFFWRRPVQRLEAEVIRDSLLFVSGSLDTRPFGPGTLDEGMKRRSIYFTVKRSKLVPMLQLFDAPDALGSMGQRPTTTIAPQALLLMNNPHVRSWAQNFARRLTDSTPLDKGLAQVVRRGYQLALQREPTAAELADATAFLQQQRQSYTGPERDHLALTDFCQVLMCLNEFVYVE